MSSALTTTLILSAVSVLLTGLGTFVRPASRICSILLLVWLAAALPLQFFLNIPSNLVLLFYLISTVFGLIFSFGGRPA